MGATLRFLPIVLSMPLCAPAYAQDTVAAQGRERAAASSLQWEVREAGHPMLGPIRFALLRTPIVTSVGRERVFSNVYVSCERNTGKIAIELTNGRAPDDPAGLKPRRMPRLVCNTRDAGAPRAEELDARWIVNELGDVMARGLWPFALRACPSIGVSEEVVLPAGWPKASAPIRFEIAPYARELDAIFQTCGERSAYAAAEAAPAPGAARAPPNGNGWILARVTSRGRTNVRERPNVRSALVARLDPGDVVLVQKSAGEWWRVKSRGGAREPFEGYARRDRIVVR